jgi:hypothetical protein
MIDKLALLFARRILRWVGRRPQTHSHGYNEAVDDARRAIGFVINVYHKPKTQRGLPRVRIVFHRK